LLVAAFITSDSIGVVFSSVYQFLASRKSIASLHLPLPYLVGFYEFLVSSFILFVLFCLLMKTGNAWFFLHFLFESCMAGL